MSTKKTIWMVSGNKGGVGKSLFCLALASALELEHEQFAVLDGDGRVGDVYATFLRKCPARLADFRELRPGAHDCIKDSDYETMIMQLLSTSDNLIVNTPDGADILMMKWFDVTLRYTETNNYQFKFMYLISDRPDGLDLLVELQKRFAFLYPIRNLHFGDESLFTAFNKQYESQFYKVVNFPSLRGEELRMLFDLKTYPAEVVRLKSKSGNFTLPSFARHRIRKWLYDFRDELLDIIENKTEPNIKPKEAA